MRLVGPVPPWLRRRLAQSRSGPGGQWLPAGLVAGALLVGSLVPIPGPMAGQPSPVPITAPFHLVGYGILAASVAGPLRSGPGGSPARTATIAVAIAVGYGAFVELLQFVWPYRLGIGRDVLLNTIGAAGWAAVDAIRRVRGGRFRG